MDTITSKAIEAAGGATAVARHLGITPQAVGQWRLVPPRQVNAMSRLSGIPPHELRPDIFPAPEAAA